MNDKQKAHRIVWLSLLASMLLYAAMPLLVAPVAEDPPQGLVLALIAATVSTTGLVIALPRLASQAPAAAGASQIRIVQWALCEALVIFGLVLYLLGGGTSWLWGLCLWSAILMGLHAPREDRVVDAREMARPDVRIG